MSSWKSQLAPLVLAAAVAACGGGTQPEPQPAASPEPAAPATTGGAPAAPAEGGEAGAAATGYEVAPVTDGGTISGKVTLTGAAPEPETVEVTKDPQACGSEKKLESVKVGAGGGLANAIVWVDGIARGKEWPAAKDGTVDQKECQYTPHVQALPVGAKLEIVNSDPVLHNIHAYTGGETLFNIAQPMQGQKTPKTLSKAGPVELKCDVHSWMQAWIFVAPHPYYAVTGEDGAFSIGDVPPGSYKVKVWHEKLGEKDAEATVDAKGTATVDVAFEPKA